MFQTPTSCVPKISFSCISVILCPFFLSILTIRSVIQQFYPIFGTIPSIFKLLRCFHPIFYSKISASLDDNWLFVYEICLKITCSVPISDWRYCIVFIIKKVHISTCFRVNCYVLRVNCLMMVHQKNLPRVFFFNLGCLFDCNLWFLFTNVLKRLRNFFFSKKKILKQSPKTSPSIKFMKKNTTAIQTNNSSTFSLFCENS